MTAQDHLHPEQFYYHGTSAELKPGDQIEPGHPHNFRHLDDSKSVYFTPHVESARWYAMTAAGDFDAAHEHTYQVQPTGEHRPDPESVGSYVPQSLQGARVSDHPLRVVREIHPEEREAGG